MQGERESAPREKQRLRYRCRRKVDPADNLPDFNGAHIGQ